MYTYVFVFEHVCLCVCVCLPVSVFNNIIDFVKFKAIYHNVFFYFQVRTFHISEKILY